MNIKYKTSEEIEVEATAHGINTEIECLYWVNTVVTNIKEQNERDETICVMLGLYKTSLVDSFYV